MSFTGIDDGEKLASQLIIKFLENVCINVRIKI